MPSPTTTTELIDLMKKCRLFESADLDAYLAGVGSDAESAQSLSDRMVEDGRLTKFQAGQLLKGKHRGFVLGKYKLLDRIGMGGMGQVFLAEHGTVGRRVAIKVLPPDRAKNEFAKKRFLREARTTGQLDHPNVIKAFDVDADGDVNFLVLEYVDGASFQEMVTRGGPMEPERAAHYLAQGLAGLQYLHDRGLIHRDIKPANLIVDRNGVVKLLDLGLVRVEADAEELTRKEDVKFLGTADYLAPEQAVDCKTVDGRADVYGLGATGYFLLTGAPPFAGETVAAKLMAHQNGSIRPVHQVKPTVPEVLSAVIQKMMAKRPEDRYATPADVIPALSAWSQGPPPPPRPEELPAGKPVGLSTIAATVNPFPSAQIKTGSNRGGNGQQTTGSGIRFYGDSSGAMAGISKSADVSPPHIFTPKPIVKNRPPALPAEATHGTITTPAPKPSPLQKLVPVSTSTPVKTTTRYSVRQWIAIALGLILTVALTAWSSVKVFAAGPRNVATQAADPPAGQ
jgi:serine/threonine protein kinase